MSKKLVLDTKPAPMRPRVKAFKPIRMTHYQTWTAIDGAGYSRAVPACAPDPRQVRTATTMVTDIARVECTACKFRLQQAGLMPEDTYVRDRLNKMKVVAGRPISRKSA